MDPTPQPETFVPPSTRARVLAALVLVITVSLGVVFVVWGKEWMLRWLSDPMVNAQVRTLRGARMTAAVLVVVVLICCATAAWFACMAWRIRNQGVFPPSSYPVLARTLQLRGVAAERKAREHAVACGLVLFLVVLALAGAFYFLPLAETLQSLG